MNLEELKELLEELYDRFNRIDFIENDPIRIPHQFSAKEDIEIAAFLSATLAWGQRKQIILKATALMNLMDNSPKEFVLNASELELSRLKKFYYRTFQSVDALFFIRALRHIYSSYNGLESIFNKEYEKCGAIFSGLVKLHSVFNEVPHELRSMKHIANVSNGSSAKRLNMFLRWMVRKDNRGVDFGLWHKIPSSALYLPLDIHTGTSARKFILLARKQNDWKSVLEVTQNLRQLDADDPVKYDFALFGAGIEKLI